MSGTPPQDADGDLLEGLRAGDDACYAELLRRYGGRLLAVARRFMRTQDDAQDAFQDAMLLAFRNIDSYRGHTSMYPWLYRITVNACLMRLRKKKPTPVEDIDQLMPRFDDGRCRLDELLVSPPPADELIRREEVRLHVRAAIDRLPDNYRSVLILRDIEERSTLETAELMDINVGTVKVRLHRARSALKKLLEPYLEENARAIGAEEGEA